LASVAEAVQEQAQGYIGAVNSFVSSVLFGGNG